MSTRYVLFYEAAEDVMETAPLHFPAHSARIQEFHAAGALLLVGTFGDPVRQGSMAVFASREGAEDFVAGDPFVLNGVVTRHEIREWDEVLGD